MQRVKADEMINFREVKFNPSIDSLMSEIRHKIHVTCAVDVMMDCLFLELEKYYSPSSNDSKKILSQFLQNAVYYACHIPPDHDDHEFGLGLLVDQLMRHDDFFCAFEDPASHTYAPILWIDPKERYTALISLARKGNYSSVKRMLDLAKIAFNGENTAGFIAFLLHQERNGFSALSNASKEGHVEIVQLLLDTAVRAFGGENTNGFRAFISNLDKDGFSPLHSASKTGHLEVVELLLNSAKKTFGGMNTTEFKAFLEKKNNYGFTPLNAACFQVNAACSQKQKEIAYLLFSNGGSLDTTNNKGYSARQNAPRDWKFYNAQHASLSNQGYFSSASHTAHTLVKLPNYCSRYWDVS